MRLILVLSRMVIYVVHYLVLFDTLLVTYIIYSYVILTFVTFLSYIVMLYVLNCLMCLTCLIMLYDGWENA